MGGGVASKQRAAAPTVCARVAHARRAMTPLNTPNVDACPCAPLRAPAICEMTGHERGCCVCLFEAMPHSVSQHVQRAWTVVDGPLLPRALFVERPSRGARMVRAALGLDAKSQQQHSDAALAREDPAERDDGLDF